MSSQLASPVKKITELRIYRFPSSTVVSIKKAIKADGLTFMLGEDGKLYSHSISDRAFYPLVMWRFARPLVNALRKLGIITSAEAKLHIEACEKADSERNRAEWCNTLRRSAAKLGITLTKRQQSALKKL